MSYYTCPQCGKVNLFSNQTGLTINSKCKFCGYNGEMKLVIIKQDTRDEKLRTSNNGIL
ncbi:hypothetical protein GF386_02145 [Candidatus Pacearchaeota archaeon]|nr:hypothetical protein [Candidatus Pacearchaeota archaeon]MBD3282969.1 hypothetical protein [Candidatus Pacearchaeota archaeon]